MVFTAEETIKWDIETDIVVVGSGSGALTTAIVGRDLGAQVALLECTDKIGGGTSYSGGLVWIGNNHYMAELGIKDSREDVVTHLRRISGGHHVEELLQDFVDVAPQMIKYLQENTTLNVVVAPNTSDYYAELEGGSNEGRTLVPEIFDSKLLGSWQDKLRLSPHFPVPVTLEEAEHWGGAYGNYDNWDWPLIGKRMEEGMVGWGAALIGPLMKACIDRDVNIMMQTRALELVQNKSGRIIGVIAEQGGKSIFIHGRLGVVLACGGYEWNEDLMRLSGAPTTKSITVPSNRGDGHTMGLEVGAAWANLGNSGIGPCISIPDEQHDGQPLYRMFIFEPAFPGMIIVNKHGERFGDEAMPQGFKDKYMRFDSTTQSYPNMPAFAIWDQNYKEKYVVSTVMPQDDAPEWITRESSIEGLALKLGIHPDNLQETVATFNTHVRVGKDPFFQRGDHPYDRAHGDKNQKPNPCLGPIEKPPFYGLKLVQAAVFVCNGLVTNRKAQVMSVRGKDISGLYAVPNVAAHLAIGLGYTSGMVHAQSMTFGYIAARHMAESKGRL